jgi:hypothetical protein
LNQVLKIFDVFQIFPALWPKFYLDILVD